MTHGITQHALATVSFLVLTFIPQSTPYSSKNPVFPAVQESIHVVKTGETLTSVAESYYGSRDYWTTIWNDNPEIRNPSIIEVGAKLKVRTEKPLLVEAVDEVRMQMLLSESVTPIDSSVAFVQAGESVAVQQPISEPTVQPAPVQQASPSNYVDVYKSAGEKYGVPWQVLYGLHLTETGQRDGEIYNKSGSGAQGPMQFMPGTWNSYGVDGNGDGVVDINNAADAIHGAANFIAKHGSVQAGLQSYGGNTSGTLTAACQEGYCQ